MITTILSFLIALLGLGFLILIHELGHYLVAKAFGMQVDAFSIGFGPSLIEWESGKTRWKVGLFFFGGYVSIAGMEGAADSSEGYVPYSAWKRLCVAIAGPAANILCTLLLLTLLWVAGGRDKPLNLYTHFLGWVERLPLKWEEEKGLKDFSQVGPGDRILKIGGKDYEGYEDLLLATILPKEKPFEIDIEEINYFTGDHSTRRFTFDFSQTHEKISFAGLFSPAALLLIGDNGGKMASGKTLSEAYLQPNDRLLWVDGRILFSARQLEFLINQPTNLLTIIRKGQTMIVRAIKAPIHTLGLSENERLDWEDIAFNAGLSGNNNDERTILPFKLSPHLEVIEPMAVMIDPYKARMTDALEPKDRIIAIDGQKVTSIEELFVALQQKKIFIVTQQMGLESVAAQNADHLFFETDQTWKELSLLIKNIGEKNIPQTGVALGQMRLVGPFSTIDRASYLSKTGQRAFLTKQEALTQVLGIPLKMGTVHYNPNPLEASIEMWQQVKFNLLALFKGDVGVGQMMGPVGITATVSQSLSGGFSEAIWWLALISLNLAVLNLLPIPVLDGGAICFAMYEIVTRRPIRKKVAEKIIIPFAIFLIGLFVYVTLHDLFRIFFSGG